MVRRVEVVLERFQREDDDAADAVVADGTATGEGVHRRRADTEAGGDFPGG
jgi:hypothetical protein